MLETSLSAPPKAEATCGGPFRLLIDRVESRSVWTALKELRYNSGLDSRHCQDSAIGT